MTQQVNQQTENYIYVIVNSLFIFYFKYLIYKNNPSLEVHIEFYTLINAIKVETSDCGLVVITLPSDPEVISSIEQGEASQNTSQVNVPCL